MNIFSGCRHNRLLRIVRQAVAAGQHPVALRAAYHTCVRFGRGGPGAARFLLDEKQIGAGHFTDLDPPSHIRFQFGRRIQTFTGNRRFTLHQIECP